MTEEEKQKLLKKLLEDKEKLIAVKKKHGKEYEPLKKRTDMKRKMNKNH